VEEGRSIGLSYFKERELRDDIIKKFHSDILLKKECLYRICFRKRIFKRNSGKIRTFHFS
jgi:hypothetical protein